jgi:hypothetical protein
VYVHTHTLSYAHHKHTHPLSLSRAHMHLGAVTRSTLPDLPGHGLGCVTGGLVDGAKPGTGQSSSSVKQASSELGALFAGKGFGGRDSAMSAGYVCVCVSDVM